MSSSTASGTGWVARAKRRVNQKYKPDFILQLPRGAKVLDVGCGNNSAQSTKKLRPDIYYVGLDVGDYNQTDYLGAPRLTRLWPRPAATASGVSRESRGDRSDIGCAPAGGS
jgi:hypothetical protein